MQRPPGRRARSSLLYSPAQDGSHIKWLPLRAELAIDVVLGACPGPWVTLLACIALLDHFLVWRAGWAEYLDMTRGSPIEERGSPLLRLEYCLLIDD